ncbi:MAG: hypothetical protein Q9181_004471 [Wetmoreana brouardii]
MKLITELGDLIWFHQCQDVQYNLEVDRYEREQDLCLEINDKASFYSEEGMIEEALYLREQLYRVHTTTLSLCHNAVYVGIHGSVYESAVELARLNELRGNFFQAELVLEEAIVLQNPKQTEKVPDWDDELLDWSRHEQAIDSLVELYGLFRDRLVKMNYLRVEAAKATILCRTARIDVDQLSERLYSVGLMPQSKELALYVAAKYNACNLARLCLGQGVDVEGGMGRSETPLHTAIRSGSMEMVELLLAHGADVEASVDTRLGFETPLRKAVRKGSVEIVLSLLSQHAFIDPRDKDRIKTLMKAAFCGRWNMIPRLFEQ